MKKRKTNPSEDCAVWQLPACPGRPDEAHKGTFGTLLLVAGSVTMPGAAALVARAAFRSGVGLVKVISQSAAIPLILSLEPSATALAKNHAATLKKQLEDWTRSLNPPNTVLALGPGLGLNPQTLRQTKIACHSDIPLVVDADGLNALAQLIKTKDWRSSRLPGSWVLTPHPGEFARLVQAMKLHPDADEQEQVKQMARMMNAIVVLKRHRTIVSDGQLLCVNHTGNSAMATAGSGDVLTGCLAALMAQGMSGWDAARLAVHLHGLAGDLWVQSHQARSGMLARELADAIPQAMEQHRRLG